MITILLITNKTDITCDFVVKRLKERGLNFYRLNTEEIGKSIQVVFNFEKEIFCIQDLELGLSVDLPKIKAVYYRRPELNGDFDNLSAGERNFVKSELLFTLEGIYKILRKAFWINTVPAIRNAENKIYQLLLAKEIGFQIPKSIVSNSQTDVKDFYTENHENCIIKPIKSGLVEGVDEEGVIFTNKVEINDSNIERVKVCPVYLQNLVPKIGDVRVTVVGDKLFAALIHSQDIQESEIDWRKSSISLKHTEIELPEELRNKCLLLTRELSLNFGAIDFVLDTGNNFIFLEINPNGQWAWVEKQLNYNISDEITTLLETQMVNQLS